ncbi:hypothetical protein [Treponema sp. R8-4-B8]
MVKMQAFLLGTHSICYRVIGMRHPIFKASDKSEMGGKEVRSEKKERERSERKKKREK